MLNIANDSKFHEHLVGKMKEANDFHFKQFKELQRIVDREIKNCEGENIDFALVINATAEGKVVAPETYLGKTAILQNPYKYDEYSSPLKFLPANSLKIVKKGAQTSKVSQR